MSRQDRPTPPLSRPSVPPPPAVYSARQQLHLRPPEWEGTINATPRELPPLETRGATIGADSSVTNSLNEIHAQAETEQTSGFDDLKKELEALKNELLDQNEDDNPSNKKKKQKEDEAEVPRTRGRVWLATSIEHIEKPPSPKEMGETMTFWKKYDNEKDTPRTNPAWLADNMSNVEAAVAHRMELQRCHREDRLKLMRAIGTRRMKDAAKLAVGGESKNVYESPREGKWGQEFPREVVASLKELGQSRKELSEARKALEKVLSATSDAGNMTAMRTLFRNHTRANIGQTMSPSRSPLSQKSPRSPPLFNRAASFEAPPSCSIASPAASPSSKTIRPPSHVTSPRRSSRAPTFELPTAALKQLDDSETPSASPRSASASPRAPATTPALPRYGKKNLTVPVLVQIHGKGKNTLNESKQLF